MDLSTIRQLFAYSDWARDRLMELAVKLPGEKLDQPFEMGPGSLRKTMEHLFGAEWVWLQRWKGRSPAKGETPHDFSSMSALWAAWRETAGQRSAYLDGLTAADLSRPITYTNTRGEVATFQLGHMLLHVCNHGTHHRTQALNMLRHLGVQPPEMDLLVMLK